MAGCTYREAVRDGHRCRRFLEPMNEADYGSTACCGAPVAQDGRWLGDQYCADCLLRLTRRVPRSRAAQRKPARLEG